MGAFTTFAVVLGLLGSPGASMAAINSSAAEHVSASAPAPGLVAAILKDSAEIADCAAQSKATSKAAFVAKAFDLKPLTLKSGERMTIASGADACVCAAQNCPTLVLLAERGGAYRTVLSEFTIEAKILPDGSAVLSSHESAAISGRSTFRWNGKTYAALKTERVDERSGAVKPEVVPVGFAPGSSSITLSGKAAVGFGDTYALHASAGQTMVLRLSAPRGKKMGGLTLFHGNTLVAQADSHWSGKLPASGEYRIAVDGTEEKQDPYTLTITVH